MPRQMMLKVGCAVLAIAAIAAAKAHAVCDTLPPPQDAPMPSGRQAGRLVPGADPVYQVQQVLERRQQARCRESLAAALAPSSTAPARAEDGYVKQTEFDNTPYRFNMTQGGKRMSADDFDAWLEANGYSVGRKAGPDEVPDP